MKNIRYTLADRSISVFELARWVLSKVGSQYSSKDALMVARELLNGNGWEPIYNVLQDPEGPGPCYFIVSDPEDPYRVLLAEAKRLQEMLEKGAAGDAEVAIAYCKMVLESGGRLGAPFA